MLQRALRELRHRLPNGLACRDACEDRVNLINQMIDDNQKVISTANLQVRSIGVFILSGWAPSSVYSGSCPC